MAAEALSPLPPSPAPSEPQEPSPQECAELDITTMPDLRSRDISPINGDVSPRTSESGVELEVATLSGKLVNAINQQTTLDDSLSTTRLELNQSLEKIRQLEDQLAQQREMLQGDVWVRRKTVESEKMSLLGRVAHEKKLRQDVEEEKRKIEQELENLTAALFEEANKMVIAAKEGAKDERDALQRRNDLLKAQLADTEGLLASQQEQLAELKQIMEQMNAESDAQTAPTLPSSPGFSKFDPKDDDGCSDGGSQPGLSEPLSPSHPTSFTHLLQPVLRTDMTLYVDFRDLIRASKRLSSRLPSGPQSSLMGLGLGLTPGPANASTTSLSNTGSSTPQTSPQSPNYPASPVGGGTPASTPNSTPLKETKFYKRVLVEDIEPTLRLDIAPGVSWLARRAVLNAVAEGSLVVEPVPTNTIMARMSKPQNLPCALCGEGRREEKYLRYHRFRTSEAESAQRYPLCKYCLGRVRSTCDFLGFLRIVKDGHWRAEDEDAEKAAWEEGVRLREQMFWARIGGGVVPAGPALIHGASIAADVLDINDKSPPTIEHRSKTKDDLEAGPLAEATLSLEVPTAKTATPVPAPASIGTEGPLKTSTEAHSSASANESSQDLAQVAGPPLDLSFAGETSATTTTHNDSHDIAQRLSVTVPGSFDT